MSKQTQPEVTSNGTDASARDASPNATTSRGTRGNAAALEDSGLAGETRDVGWYDAIAGAMLDGEVDALDVPDRSTMVTEIQFQRQKLTDWHPTLVGKLTRDLGAKNAGLAASQRPALEECLRALLVDVVTIELKSAFGTLGPLVGRVLRVGGLQGPKGEGPDTVSVSNTGSVRTLLTARAIGAAQTTLTTQATNAIEAKGGSSGPADGETLEAFFVDADLRLRPLQKPWRAGPPRRRGPRNLRSWSLPRRPAPERPSVSS